MKVMCELLQQGRAPAELPRVLAERNAARFAGVGRNDPCPCGSRAKFKKCHTAEAASAGDDCKQSPPTKGARQMLCTMDRSTDSVLCYKLSGDVTKADYQTLTPAVAAAIKSNGSISLLFDLTGLHWEKASAWGSDLDFGKQFGGNVEKMAIVGDKRWEKHVAKLAQPYYAKEAKYFDTDDDAWSWLTS